MEPTVPVVTVNPPASPQGASVHPSTHTPMILTTDVYGNQVLSPLAMQPVIFSPLATIPFMWPKHVMDGMQPMVYNSFRTPSPSPVLPTPSASPLPIVAPNVMPVSIPSNSAEGLGLPVVIDSNASSDSAETFNRSRSRSVNAHVLGDIEPFTSERVQPIQNEKNVPVPTFDATMTKKDLVNTTLDWMYEVCGGSHFDCEGRRGENVLRLKVKTCGALSYICPLINRCIEESLVCHVSCPISTKKQRKQIRGYLVYIEGVSPEACDRIVEIFNEVNAVYVKNSENQVEHPFKGISRNPIPVRERTDLPQRFFKAQSA